MAIIKCPECGGSISSTAENCVHCGFRFKVCPECGAASEKSDEMCKSCGFRFVKKAEMAETLDAEPKADVPKPKVEEAKTAEKEGRLTARYVFNQYDSECPSKIKLVRRGLCVGQLVIFLIIMIMIFVEMGNGPGAATEIFCILLGASVLVFFVQKIIECFGIYRDYVGFVNWTKRKKYALKNIISDSFISDYERLSLKEIKDVCVPHKRAIDAQVCVYDPRAESNYNIFSAAEVILHSAAYVMTFIWVIIMLDTLLLFNSWSFFEKIMIRPEFIILLVINILLLIANSIVTTIRNKRHENIVYNWLKKNAPEHIDEYIVYVKPCVKHLEAQLKSLF